jgi:anti-sigma B factor antagonist
VLTLKITTRCGKSSAMIEVLGAINVYSASVVGQAIQSQITDGVKSVALDLSSVGSIDSAGLGTLVGNAKALASVGGSLSLIGVNGRVLRLLETTKLVKYFQIEDQDGESGDESQIPAACPASSEEGI